MIDKRILKRHILLLTLILLVGCLRLLLEQVFHWQYGCAVSVFYITFYYCWMRSCRQRFSQKSVRQFITVIGFFLIAFALLRLIKLEFCIKESVFSRYIWYLYYVPITLLPTLNFHAMLFAVRPDSAAPSRRWNVLYVPVGLMVLGVLTNDLHQLAFCFPPDMVHFELYATHGPLFRIVTAWVVLMIVSLFFVLIRSCINRRLYRNLWLPALVATFGLLYRLTYNFNGVGDKFFLQKMYEVPELLGLIWIAVWESAVSSRLLPSNRGYLDFLEASSLRAGITDAAFAIRKSFGDTLHPTAAQLSAAANGALPMQNGSTVLKVRPVRGGWFYWSEDLRELNALNEALENTADYLTEENAMLQQAAEIEEERRRTAHQTQLYDEISDRILPRIGVLNGLLSDPPAEEEAFRDLLKRAAVVFAFLKRFSNLLLLADAQNGAASKDLQLCLEESARALRQRGAACQLCVEDGIDLPNKTGADLYELFELLIEAVLPVLTVVCVCLQREDGSVFFEIEYQTAAEPACDRETVGEIRAHAARLGSLMWQTDGARKHLRVEAGKEVGGQ